MSRGHDEKHCIECGQLNDHDHDDPCRFCKDCETSWKSSKETLSDLTRQMVGDCNHKELVEWVMEYEDAKLDRMTLQELDDEIKSQTEETEEESDGDQDGQYGDLR